VSVRLEGAAEARIVRSNVSYAQWRARDVARTLLLRFARALLVTPGRHAVGTDEGVL
jgi:hypothetical protein